MMCGVNAETDGRQIVNSIINLLDIQKGGNSLTSLYVLTLLCDMLFDGLNVNTTVAVYICFI